MKLFITFILMFSIYSHAQRGSAGHGREYKDVFHYLLEQHNTILRNVEFIENGVKTYTYSSNPKVANHIKKHVVQMKGLVESGKRIRNWDPLFGAIFDNYELIEMKVIQKERGVEVIETSYDPYVAKLIQEHAKVVSLFVKYGFEEARRSHPVPLN